MWKWWSPVELSCGNDSYSEVHDVMASFKTVAGRKVAQSWAGPGPVIRHMHGRLPHGLFVLVPSALSENHHTFCMTAAQRSSERAAVGPKSLCLLCSVKSWVCGCQPSKRRVMSTFFWARLSAMCLYGCYGVETKIRHDVIMLQRYCKC